LIGAFLFCSQFTAARLFFGWHNLATPGW
jgi:hypothetical protein